MRDPRKGCNFRFSEDELRKLDDLVIHFEKNAEWYMFWKAVNRTDVLRFLIQTETQKIEEAARHKMEEEAAAAAAVPKKRIRKKKAGAA